MHRLLILACSQRKNPAAGVLPAIERYDGPAFRVLRKYLVEAPEDAPVVLILSAKFGLIDSTKSIPDYDCLMSTAIAERLRPSVLESLGCVLRSQRWLSIALCVGKNYRAALDGVEQVLPDDAQVKLLDGGQGRRLTRLRAWLRADEPRADRLGAR